MNNGTDDLLARTGVDVPEYCRRVEEHLARVNQGHIIRIVGASFELVRGWARAGIPLSVACYGIDRKAERHRAGQARRALRLEFCEPDVQEAFDRWRRAVGVGTGLVGLELDLEPGGPEPANEADGKRRAEAGGPNHERRAPSLSRELDRAMERLVRATGRLDLPDSLREAMASTLESLAPLREQARHARGPARESIAARLVALDEALAAAARIGCGSGIEAVQAEAVAELAAYRGRLAPDAWRRSVEAGVDRLLRDRYGLPTLDPDRV